MSVRWPVSKWLVVILVSVPPLVGWFGSRLLWALEPCNSYRIDYCNPAPCDENYPDIVYCSYRSQSDCEKGPGTGDESPPWWEPKCIHVPTFPNDHCVVTPADCLPKLTCKWDSKTESCKAGAAYGGSFTADRAVSPPCTPAA